MIGDRHLELASAALQNALERNPSKTTEVWANEESGNSGSVAPLRTYRTAEGYYCRKFRVTVFSVNNGQASALGTACRDRDEIWKSIRQ